MHHPTDRIIHTTAFVTPVVEHWLEQEIAQWVHSMKDRSNDPSHHERTLLPRSYISLPPIDESSTKMFISAIGEERNVLFNDTLNTFYLSLCGMRHMVKNHSDERGNPLPQFHGLIVLAIGCQTMHL